MSPKQLLSMLPRISINMERSNLWPLYLTADDLYDRQAILNADIINPLLSVHDMHFWLIFTIGFFYEAMRSFLEPACDASDDLA